MEQRAVSVRWDAVFRALAAEPRREIVAELRSVGPDTAVSLPGAAIPETQSVDRDRLRVDLHHNHLPMLVDSGYVEWSKEPFEAERGPSFAEIGRVLEAIVDGAESLPLTLVEGCPRLERAAGSG